MRYSILAFFIAIPLWASATDVDDFRALLDEHWASTEQEKVIFHSDPDAFRMNGTLPEFSAAAVKRRQQYNETMLTRLAGIDADKLIGQDRVSHKLFRYERLTEREHYQQLDRYFPINSLFGYHTYFVQAPANMAFLDVVDYENYLVSLADFPRYNDEHLAILREAADKGYTQHCHAMRKIPDGIAALIVDKAQDSPLYAPFANFPRAVTEQDRVRLEKAGRELIAKKVMPAYRALQKVYTTDYMPRCRKTAGINSIAGGDEYYAYLLRYFTTTDMTPAAIHKLGLKEIARIRVEMAAIKDRVKFDGDLDTFIRYLRTSPKFFATSEAQLLGQTALIAKTAEGEMPKYFTVLPRGTYNIKSVPSTAAYYMPSAGDGKTSGTYFIGTGDLMAQPLYGLTALTLHEGVPGHHLQNALAFELDLPQFRRHLSYSAYGEGWGLYCERLGLEMGLYKNPYDDFGRLTYEAWRAARLVVDTGLHAFGWSRDKAIDYMLANTGLTKPEVVDQIDRYITWPAQATSYKIGEIRIRQMRARAERELGSRFDIRRFHDTLVGSASVPIAVLDEIVDEWIASQQGD